MGKKTLMNNDQRALAMRMKDFAPVPLSALTPDLLSLAEFRLLTHLLGLRTFFAMQDCFELSDHQLLNGINDWNRKQTFPGCSLSRNTMKAARKKLEQMGYIRVQFCSEDLAGNRYRYELVSGKAIVYDTPHCQQMTTELSASDPLYKEENEEHPHRKVRRDDSKRRTRQLPEDSKALHKVLLDEISAKYRRSNRGGHVMPYPARAGAALKRLLLDNPTYGEAELLRAIRHRFKSEVNHRPSPHTWIPKLFDYIDAPLDRYSRPDPARALKTPSVKLGAAKAAIRRPPDQQVEHVM
jgi:DNA-binding MarR family transcriptional regulator